MGIFGRRQVGRVYGLASAVSAAALCVGLAWQASAQESGFRFVGSPVEFVPFDPNAPATQGGPSSFKYYGGSPGFHKRINVRDDLSPLLPFGAGGSLDSADVLKNVVFVELFAPGFGSFVCSGTLINARSVLTAGHCVRGLDTIVPDGNFQPHIYFGNDVLGDFFAFNSLPGTSHLGHAGFDPNAFFLGNDIALISLSSPVFATGTTRPGLRSGIPYVQLATTAPAIGADLTLVGYGQAGTGSAPGSLFDLKRRIATNQNEFVGLITDLFGPIGTATSNLIFTDFENPLDTFNTDLFFTEIVTANEGTTDNGDSGGPLFATIGGQQVQVGVTSGGAQFGPLQGGYADLAFWTSVADFSAWIAANSPLQATSSVAGNADWSLAAHWSGAVIPDNFDTPVGSIADFTNPARYYNVTLGAAGITALTDAREIDLLTIAGAGAQLNVTPTGNLFVWSDATVTSGVLRVDGTIDVAKLILNGGRLQGTGSVISAVAAATNTAGVVAPGNSIGTLTIVGNYVQGPTGLLEIELTNGAGDVLAVTGNASLAGAVSFQPFGPMPLLGQTHRFLTTGGTRSGQFTGIIDLLPGELFPVVTYGANFADVTVRGLCTTATGPLQTPVCSALADPAVQSDPDMIPAIAGLQSLVVSDDAAFRRALEALNPTRAHAQSAVGFSAGDLLRNQFGRRTHDLLGGATLGSAAQADMRRSQLASAEPSAEMLASAATAALSAADGASNMDLPNGYAMFFAADGALTDTDQPAGIGVDEADVAALTAGLDHGYGDGLMAGVALSYLQGNVVQDYGFGGSTTSDGVAISGYGSMHRGLMYVDAFLSYAWHDFETERRLLVGPGTFATAEGATDASHIQAGATFGYGLNTDARASIGAVGGLYYINLDIDGYTETGAGPLSAVIPSRTIDSLRGQIGAEMSFELEPGNQRLVPILRLVWNHEFMDDALLIRPGFAGAPATTFTTPGPDLGSDWATVGFGLTGRVSDGTSFYFRYQHDFGRDGQENQEVSAAARMAF